MPADYNSAARALALPISPIPSPSPDRQRSRPQWSRFDSQQRMSFNSRRNNNRNSPGTRADYQAQITRSANIVYKRFLTQFLKLTPLQRVLVVIGLILMNVFGILFLIYNEKIFSYLAPAAQKWHAIRFGWTILWFATFICAFPPLIGYSTTITISGFVYGFPGGWFIVASATVAGSFASFIASRTVLSSYVHRLVGEDKRFQALALTLKHDGLKVLCMIRFCPLPYSLSNAALSTFPTVHPLSYALATAIASPKLLIHVFIGSRLAQIAESGGKMDAGTKAVNWISIILGSVLGAAVGYIIYQKTISRARELEAEEIAVASEEGRGTVGSRERERERERGAYTDAIAGDEDAAVLMDPDDISLWGNDEAGEYRDGFTDDDDDAVDVFAKGDVGSDSEGRRGSGK